MGDTQRLIELDRHHIWHPFTAMRQWREADPIVIERGDGPYLFDTDGNRYIDGVASMWCNVHGHRVGPIDRAIQNQMEQVSFSSLLGLASPPSIELGARLCQIAPGQLNKVFYSDSGATAVEVAFKMAVGYWYHSGQPQKHRFIGFSGAYHGDTNAAMSVGFCELFHRPFLPLLFEISFVSAPDPCRPPAPMVAPARSCPVENWPSEDSAMGTALRDHCMQQLELLLQEQGGATAAVVIEPLVQGAAGMICQPPGFLQGVRQLSRRYGTLLIADEVATGFGRTGRMFACEHEGVEPDIMCLAKGLSGGYLPLAATLATDQIEAAFTGSPDERRTLYHGHTFTGHALACAAALASLDLFDSTQLLGHVDRSAAIVADRLVQLRSCPHVLDVRQRGLMVGIELCGGPPGPFEFDRCMGAAVCAAMRPKGLLLRPLGDVLVLMPVLAMPHDVLNRMLDIVIETISTFNC